jgi:hypothetical protein
MLLTEQLSPSTANLTEMKTRNGDFYLSGIMMQSEVKNGNGRLYRRGELENVVRECTQRMKDGFSILGELNHPDDLNINLLNVSHTITEMRMDGNNVIGKMKLLNTPSGNIAKAIMEGGVRLGVSSRGTGSVNESGEVSAFAFTCVDIVSTPSAPGAYPSLVQEALAHNKIRTLAEAVVHDQKAQKFFKKEILALLETIQRRK